MKVLLLLALAARVSAASEAHEALVSAFERRLQLHSQPPLGPPRASQASRGRALEATARLVAAHDEASRGFSVGWNAMSDLSDDEYRDFLRSRPENTDEQDPHFRGHGDRPIVEEEDHKRQRSPEKKKTKKHMSVTVDSMETQTSDSEAVSASGSYGYDFQEDESDANVTIPASLNWATLANGKYETPIKNQGTCGSCWAFSGISVLESRVAIALDLQAEPLSVEQVLSCSSALDHVRARYDRAMFSSSEGCAGGMPFLTYEYLSRMSPHGVACESTYPYEMYTASTSASDEYDADLSTCKTITSDEVAVSWTSNVSDYRVVKPNSENALLRALLTGPISANMDASGSGFRHYSGGIYDASDCLSDGKEVNHAVVIVGFGETDAGDKYWVVRNTWGTMWGENGYMRITRDVTSTHGPCNLYLYSTYPVNLTSSANESSLSTCALSTETYDALAVTSLLALDALQWLTLFGVAILCAGGGIGLLYGMEAKANRKEAQGEFSYRESYKRWVLPSREQIIQVVEARRRSSEARRRRLSEGATA